MSYDDVEIEDMEWSDDLGAYTYPCPCGDLFQITKVGALPAVCTHHLFSRALFLISCAVYRRSLLLGKKLPGVQAVLCTLQLFTTR